MPDEEQEVCGIVRRKLTEDGYPVDEVCDGIMRVELVYDYTHVSWGGDDPIPFKAHKVCSRCKIICSPSKSEIDVAVRKRYHPEG